MSNIRSLFIAALLLGKGLATIGVVAGAANLLSGDAPLWLAAAGVVVMYLAIGAAGVVGLWRMDI